MKTTFAPCTSLAVLVLAATLASPQSVTASQAHVQNAAPNSANAVVPNLTRFSGTLNDVNGKPLTGITGVTFSLYKDEQGGAALWMEIQNVSPDKNGRYTVMLGSTTSQGLPVDLFASGEARWLGVQPQGENENPRVLLVSVPYAMKAADAETLGGLPASAFLLAAPQNSVAATASVNATAASSASSSTTAPPPGSSNVTTAGGTVNMIPLFTTTTNIQNSILTQTSTTSINVGGKLNLLSTGAATATQGFNSRPQDFVSSVFNSSSKAAVAQTFQWQAEPVSNNTSSPSGKLNLLFGAGSVSPAETGLSISNKGLLTFATGQTFPTVTGNETVTGNLSASQLISTVTTGTAPLQVNSTTQVANLNTSLLGGLPATAFASLGPNTYIGDQTITGNLNLTGSINGGVLVGSGTNSNVVGASSFVGGGSGNSAGVGTTYGTVGGGQINVASTYATVGGGYRNDASGDASVIAGGWANVTNGGQDTIGGGLSNTTNGYSSTVAGGQSNSATADFSTIPGGADNVSSGMHTFAAGTQAEATFDGSFVWSDDSGSAFADLAPNMFMARASGGFFFSTTVDSTVAAWLPSGSGSWVALSDRNVKAHFSPVDGQQLLRKLARVPMQTWNYKTQAPSIRHIGPMAQDFRAAFGLGEDERHISEVDGQGVAMAGVQALYKLSLEKDKKIADLSRQFHRQARAVQASNLKIEQLTQRCAELAKLSARLAAVEDELKAGRQVQAVREAIPVKNILQAGSRAPFK